MHDSKRFLHPEAIKRIARLDLRARHVVEGFLSGMHRSPYFGQSVEFRQHRQYTYGDDLRYVDWKVWAKQDRYYVKQFEEDTNLRCTLLCDVSGSMRYGRGRDEQVRIRLHVAVSLAYLLLRQQDAVGCVAFDDAARVTVPLRTKRNHLDSIIQALELAAPRQKTDLYQILRNVAESYSAAGADGVVSDLLVERAGLFRGLRLLRSRGHDVMVFHILDDDELDFPFNGPDALRGPGTARAAPLQSPGVARGIFGGPDRIFGGNPPRLFAAQRRLRSAPHQSAARRRPGRVPEQPAGNAPKE